MQEKPKLTPKQQRFVEEYVIDCNATQAAIRAGYSEKTAQSIGAENLTKPVIKAYIDEHLAEIRSKCIADTQEILGYLTSVMCVESKSSVLAVEGIGNGSSEARILDKPPDEKERIKAAELLGKRHGIWTERKEVVGDLELNINLDYGDGEDGS